MVARTLTITSTRACFRFVNVPPQLGSSHPHREIELNSRPRHLTIQRSEIAQPQLVASDGDFCHEFRNKRSPVEVDWLADPTGNTATP
jgi:hypothetical protein